MSFSFYDILNDDKILTEAPDENSGAGDSSDDFSIDANPDTSSTDDTNSNDSDSNDNGGSDDDFDMGSLDDSSIDSGDDSSSSDSSTSDDNSSDSSNGDDGMDEDAVEANTDIFASLSAQEQAIKISQLKTLFGNLYSSIDETLEKLNEIEFDETNREAISKITSDLYTIRVTLLDYIVKIFDTKSYIENDIAFNRFLADINFISSILEKIKKQQDKQELS